MYDARVTWEVCYQLFGQPVAPGSRKIAPTSELYFLSQSIL